MDLLVMKDWWTALEGSSSIVEKELPPLSGVEDLIAINQSGTKLANEKNASDSIYTGHLSTTDTGSFPKGLVIAVVLFSLILLIGTFVLNKNRE